MKKRSKAHSGNYVGHVDVVGYGMLGGWIVDLEDPRRSVEVVVHAADTSVIGQGTTSLPREDISMLHEAAATPGFMIPIDPRALRDGPMELVVKVKGSNYRIAPIPQLHGPDPITVRLDPADREALNNAQHVLAALKGNISALISLNNDVHTRAKVDPGLGNVFIINGAKGSASELFRAYEAAAVIRRMGYSPIVFGVEELPFLSTSHILACIFVRVALDGTVARFVAQLKKDKVKIISDFDDLVFRPSLMHKIDGVRFLSTQEKQAYAQGMLQYREMIAQSNLVLVTTKSLARECEQYNDACLVVGNYPLECARAAAEAVAETRARPEQFTIGYYSGTLTHQADFRQCAAPLAAFLRRNRDARLRIVGKFNVEEFPEFRHVARQVERREFLPYADMIRDIASCTLAIAPLEVGNEFCEAKSELKFFDAALTATPIVASATDNFVEVIQHGSNGFLARSPLDWLNILETCYLDRSLVAKVGANARSTVAARFGRTQHLDAYRKAFVRAGVAGAQLPGSAPCQAMLPAAALKAGRVRAAKTLAILLPDIIIGSGGHRKALSFCREYTRRGGRVEVCVISTRSDAELQELVRTYFFSDCGHVRAFNGVAPDCDVAVATSWPTAYEVAEWTAPVRKYYFVQDFEPLFSPMSAHYVQAMHSYKLGLELVSFGRWNAHKLKKDFGLDSVVVDFPLDHEIYFHRPAPRNQEVIFYARPSQPRRLYELGRDAINILRPYAPDWNFTFFGEDIDVEGMMGVRSAGRITDLAELSQLYSQASLGIAFSTTNPSLIPFEMLACGLPVVDVDLGYDGADFAGCDARLLAPPTPKTLAKLILKTMSDKPGLATLSAKAAAWARRLPSENAFATDVLKALRLV